MENIREEEGRKYMQQDRGMEQRRQMGRDFCM
jgi:hypothetical protein